MFRRDDPRSRLFFALGLVAAFLVLLSIFAVYYKPFKGLLARVTRGRAAATRQATEKEALPKGLTFSRKRGIPTSAGELDAEAVVNFTKKVACQQNAGLINAAVELWYVQHEGQWPKEDLSDIGRDRDYFPTGIPVCPVTGGAYHLDPQTHRVMGHAHEDIEGISVVRAKKQPPEKPGKEAGGKPAAAPGSATGGLDMSGVQ